MGAPNSGTFSARVVPGSYDVYDTLAAAGSTIAERERSYFRTAKSPGKPSFLSSLSNHRRSLFAASIRLRLKR